MNWYLECLKKYAVFRGRARRREYWWFALINAVIYVALGMFGGAAEIVPDIGASGLATLYWLATLVPSIAVGVRRMHDTDHRGWWLLVPIVNLVFALKDGQRAENRFGPDPKASAAAAA